MRASRGEEDPKGEFKKNGRCCVRAGLDGVIVMCTSRGTVVDYWN